MTHTILIHLPIKPSFQIRNLTYIRTQILILNQLEELNTRFNVLEIKSQLIHLFNCLHISSFTQITIELKHRRDIIYDISAILSRLTNVFQVELHCFHLVVTYVFISPSFLFGVSLEYSYILHAFILHEELIVVDCIFFLGLFY